MKVTYPTSIQTLPRLDVSDVHIAFSWGMGSSDYISALAMKRSHGEKVYVVGRYPGDPMKVDGAISAEPSTLNLIGNTNGYLIRSVDTYLQAVNDSEVNILPIAAEKDPYMRPQLLKAIVDGGYFCSLKDHWLYGVSDPAELGIYSSMFSRFIVSRITLAICSACFLYSMFGARFSIYDGRIEKIPCIDDHKDDLGMGSGRLNYGFSSEQLRVFFRNQEVVQDFAEGKTSQKFSDKLQKLLESGEVGHVW